MIQNRYFGLAFAISMLCFAAEQRQPMIGEAAPAFRLTSIDGRSVALADLRGKNVVIHFAASW